MPAVIEIKDLSKTYVLGEIEVHALRGVSLAIEHGEFVAIMGASGSGKSTLMNILGCLDRPSRGQYLLEGSDVSSLDDEALAAVRSRRIGFVFQSFNLLSRTSALENVELPLFYSALSKESEKRASELLQMVGLNGREQNHPNQLSGGQQQRVAIARALVNDPAIVLADEPTGNLDSKNSNEIMEIISRLNHERGITVIVVTHEPEVADYADRVITFRDGVILSDERKPSVHHRASQAVPVAAVETAVAPISQEMWTFAAMAITAAARALRRNKMRALLTMLGIFIGVGALIAMVAVGDGARASVQAQIQSLGTNLLVVMPGATTANGVRAGLGSTSTLTVNDADAIAREVHTVSAISYVDRQVAQVVNANRNWATSITGATPSYLIVREWPVALGRSFTEEEARSAAPVCLLGQTVANNLFGEDENPVGATIRVRNFPLRVIGVLSIKGQSNWGQDQDDVVIMPFKTAQTKVLGVAAPVMASAAPATTNPVLNPYIGVPTTNQILSQTSASAVMNPFGGAPKITGVVHMIFAKATSADAVHAAQKQIDEVLRQRHHINAGEDEDFTVRNLNDIAQASESASKVMTTLLAAVASISLLVGGIGIMNIMLVSVTERTREIGIRMAVGARRNHILLQFLVEALLLSVVGGLLGALLGIASSKAISVAAGWPTLLSWEAVAGGFGFSAAVGMFFGYYPARKASLLNPIDALRYE
jgi:macrolide transport system ATP-binding/permease protein